MSAGKRVAAGTSVATRPLVRLGAFAALGCYGALRWSTMLGPAPRSRLFGELVLAVAVAAAGPSLRARSRAPAILGAGLCALAALALAGIPLAWIVHIRVGDTADAIGQGLAALPGVLVPYVGINEWVRVVIVLGGGVLLLDAGLMLAFASPALGDLRRAGAALPLVALAVVPSALARPALPYVHGLLLFALLAAFMWGERLPRRRLVPAIALAGLAGIAAIAAAPALDRHSAWLDYQALAGKLAPGHVETFDWAQRYGPLHWPRAGREVLDVQARRPDYWKAEDLDLFDGTGWSQGNAEQLGAPAPAPDPAARARWTQTIQVTIRAMRTSDVIAAGFASAPTDLAHAVLGGSGPGTWTADTDLQPGDSYRVSTYSPRPTAAQLSAAVLMPADRETTGPVAGYRSILLPAGPGSGPAPGPPEAPEIVFPPFHSSLPIESVIGIHASDGTVAVKSSPYGRAFLLARSLARDASTPYAFVRAVLGHLAHGYRYDERPPPSRYPLERFLFADRRGYCQQFAGAMALLLRMGGVPARVAVGFTTGTHASASHRWVVSDLDAHAWVEAWFPRYGWVRFDPTPAAAPARGGHVPLPALQAGSGGAASVRPLRRPQPASAGVRGAGAGKRAGAGVAGLLASRVVVVLGLVMVALVLVLVLRAAARRSPRTGEELVAELGRALVRTGRPLSGGVTLVALEHRFRSSTGAAAYVRAIRLTRFAGASEPPSAAQRRELRAALRAGLGPAGRLRALWALPPRLGERGRPRGAPSQ